MAEQQSLAPCKEGAHILKFAERCLCFFCIRGILHASVGLRQPTIFSNSLSDRILSVARLGTPPRKYRVLVGSLLGSWANVELGC